MNPVAETTPISITLIVKNCATALRACLVSLRSFIRPCDEIIILDTVSGDDTRSVLQQSDLPPRAQIVLRRAHLCRSDMLVLVKKYLPEQYPRCAEDTRFKRGFLRSFAE